MKPANMMEYLDDNFTTLEEEFWKQLPPEDLPLDDQMPDFLQDSDEWHDFIAMKWKEYRTHLKDV